MERVLHERTAVQGCHASRAPSTRVRSGCPSGFSLAETLVATTILVLALTSLAQLFAIAIHNVLVARNSSLAAILAMQKMEQLRGLAYSFDLAGLPITDTTTDTAVWPEAATGGTGLAPAPSNSMRANNSGHVDYLNARGISLGGGSSVPAGAVWIRRWMIEPLPTNPNNTIVIQVLVTRHRDREAPQTGPVARQPEDALLVTVKTRKAQ